MKFKNIILILNITIIGQFRKNDDDDEDDDDDNVKEIVCSTTKNSFSRETLKNNDEVPNAAAQIDESESHYVNNNLALSLTDFEEIYMGDMSELAENLLQSNISPQKRNDQEQCFNEEENEINKEHIKIPKQENLSCKEDFNKIHAEIELGQQQSDDPINKERTKQQLKQKRSGGQLFQDTLVQNQEVNFQSSFKDLNSSDNNEYLAEAELGLSGQAQCCNQQKQPQFDQQERLRKQQSELNQKRQEHQNISPVQHIQQTNQDKQLWQQSKANESQLERISESFHQRQQKQANDQQHETNSSEFEYSQQAANQQQNRSVS